MKKILTNKYFINFVLLAISLGIIIYFCVTNNNLFTLISILSSLQSGWLATALVVVLMSWWLDSFIIKTITATVYDNPYTAFQAVKVTMVGQYFNAITPFAVAGQPMQILAMNYQGISTRLALSIIIRKFLVYQTSLALYSLIVIVFKFSYFTEKIQGFTYLSLIGFASQAAMVGLLFLFSVNRTATSKLLNWFFFVLKKLRIIKDSEQICKNCEEQLDFYLENNKTMNRDVMLTIRLYILTFVQLTIMFSVPFFVYKAFHNPGFDIFGIISAQAMVSMISSCIPLPGGTGATEAGFLVIFNVFFSSETINQAMLLCRFINYYLSIVVSAPFAATLVKKRKP